MRVIIIKREPDLPPTIKVMVRRTEWTFPSDQQYFKVPFEDFAHVMDKGNFLLMSEKESNLLTNRMVHVVKRVGSAVPESCCHTAKTKEALLALRARTREALRVYNNKQAKMPINNKSEGVQQ